jgi:RNA polymerase sigma-32 factor
MNSKFLPLMPHDDGFHQYVEQVKHIPSLDPQEEYLLSKRFYDHQDIEAAHRLVTSHLKLVVKIAASYKGYGLPMVELVSEGNIGLMHAVKKFEPDKGFRLSTYAIWWIKASIQEYVLKSWSLVKIGTTAAQKKLFFNLNKVKKRLRAAESGDFRSMSPQELEQIASELDVKQSDVVEMEQRMKRDSYLDDPLNSSQDSELLIDVIPAVNENIENKFAAISDYKFKKALLHKALSQLDEREREILMSRRLSEEPLTLDTLSKKFDISKERVRQIEEKTMDKLKLLVAKHEQ